MKRIRLFEDDDENEENNQPEQSLVYRKDLWLEVLQLFINKLHELRSTNLEYARMNYESELQLCLLIVCEPWLIPYIWSEDNRNNDNEPILKMLYSCELIDMTYNLIRSAAQLRATFVTLTSVQRNLDIDEVPREKQMHSINFVASKIKSCIKEAMMSMKNDTKAYGDVTAQMDDGPTTTKNKGVYSRICKLIPLTLTDPQIETIFKNDCEVLYQAYYRYLRSTHKTIAALEIKTTDSRAINRALFIVWQLCKRTHWYDTSISPPWMLYNFKNNKTFLFVDEIYLDLTKRVQLMNRRFAWYMRPLSLHVIDADPMAPHIMSWFEDPKLHGLCMMTIAMSIVDFSTSRLCRMILSSNSPYYHVYSLLPSVIARWIDKDTRQELCNFHICPSTNTTIVNVVLGFILQDVPHYIRFDLFCALYKEITENHPLVTEKYKLLFEWWSKKVQEVNETPQPKPTKPLYGSFFLPTDLDPDGWTSSDEQNGICAWVNIHEEQHVSLDSKRSFFKHTTNNGSTVVNGLLQEIYYMATDHECMPWNLGRIIMKSIVINIALPSVRRLFPPTIKMVRSISEFDKYTKPDIPADFLLSKSLESFTPPIEEDLLQNLEKKTLLNFLETLDLIIPVSATETIIDLTDEPNQNKRKPLLRSWILADTNETCDSKNIFPVYSKNLETLQVESTELKQMKLAVNNLYNEHLRIKHDCYNIQMRMLEGEKRTISLPKSNESIMYK